MVHIKILNCLIYVERALLTSDQGSKLAKVFSQKNLSRFEFVRDPEPFKNMLDYLRQDRQISRLNLDKSDSSKLIQEINYWGIS